ncbi:MAG: dihydrofolate reductase [Rickettsiales bacterium]|nr:dihydrofolate reductase [Rickettsiales bacterium]
MMQARKPEIILIIAMNENGLIGKDDKMPWKSSLDFLWFQKNTMGWPCIFGTKTAQGMSQFPLKNRPCAVVTQKSETHVIPPMPGHGPYLSFGPGAFYNSIGEALQFYKNFDRIFMCGGVRLYQSALMSKQLWFDLVGTSELDKQLVDTIVKTTFAGGNIQGNVFLKSETLAMMSQPDFKTLYSREYELDIESKGFYKSINCKNHSEEIKEAIDMPFEHQLRNGDTPFSKIRFEILKRVKENPSK